MPSYPGDGVTFPYASSGDMLGAAITIPVVSIILVALRFYARYQQSQQRAAGFGLDDVFSLITLLAMIAKNCVTIYGVQIGVIAHPTPSPPASLTDPAALATWVAPSSLMLQKFLYILLIMTVAVLGLTKITLLLFLRRVFVPGRQTPNHIAILTSTIIVGLWTIAYTVGSALECGSTPSAMWSPPSPETAHACNPAVVDALGRGMVITNFLLDLVVLVLPFPIIWRLNLNLSKKLALTGIFLIGIMSIIAAVARIVLYVQVSAMPLKPKTADLNLTLSLLLYWCTIEIGLAFFASQLPSLSWFLKQWSRRSASSSKPSGQSSGGEGRYSLAVRKPVRQREDSIGSGKPMLSGSAFEKSRVTTSTGSVLSHEEEEEHV